MSFDGRSGDLGAILSSSASVGKVETDTAISRPVLSHQFVLAHSRPFHALQEECSLNEDTLFRFRDRFQFLEETRIRLPRKEMTTKFNQEFYTRIKGKKNEPLLSLGQHRLRLTNREREREKEAMEKGSSTPVLDEGRVASPALSVEEISPRHKKHKTSDKGKGKIGASI
ncbi:hypothetical protein SO802_022073 [Lithocarpus litseifolius]|uniref:Uncharacterized protein n=1 Tax=Lithocarpus litseifolius TaxID=425828 RepID=A0AAW2CIK9_9ROSI